MAVKNQASIEAIEGGGCSSPISLNALVSLDGETARTSRHDNTNGEGSTTAGETSTSNEAHDMVTIPDHEKYGDIRNQSSCESTNVTCDSTESAPDVISRKTSSSGVSRTNEIAHTVHVSSKYMFATWSSIASNPSNVRPELRLDGDLDRLTGDSVPANSNVLGLPNPAVHAKLSTMESRIDKVRHTSSRFFPNDLCSEMISTNIFDKDRRGSIER
jgi:hypothetical protein